MKSWITTLQVYLEERGLDTVFRMLNITTGKEAYILEKWGESKNENKIKKWVKHLRAGLPKEVGNIHIPCIFDDDSLLWSGKAILNSISLEIWEIIEKSSPPYPLGPKVFCAIIRKKQYLNESSVRKMVNDFQGMNIIPEPGQDVNTFSNMILEITNCIEGSGGAPDDLCLIVAGKFLGSTVNDFEVKVLGLYDRLDEDTACLDIQTMVKKFQRKYDCLVTLDMWTPKHDRKLNKNNELAALTATVANLVQKLKTSNKDSGDKSGGKEAYLKNVNPEMDWKRMPPKEGEYE